MASNMYLKLDGPNVVGESTDADHPGQIEILSFSHGESNTGNVAKSGGGPGAGKVNIQDILVRKYLDKSSPILNLACCTGKVYEKATIQLFRATKDAGKPIKYMEYYLENVLLSSYSITGNGGDVPVENLTFSFGKIRWSYIPQKKESPGGADAAIATSWDLTKNTPANV